MSMDDFYTDENIVSFLSECREMIEDVEPGLIELGQSSNELGEVDEETTNRIFRLFHSIKGSAGFLQFDNVVEVTHEAETLLDLFRSGQAIMTRAHTDVLCRTCDLVNSLLDCIENSGNDHGLESEVKQLTVELSRTITGGSEASSGQDEEQTSSLVAEINENENQAEPGRSADDFILEVTPEMVAHFVGEADEQLEKVEQALLELEKSPDSSEQIQEAFRNIHSFKGNCGFLGFADLETLSHKIENALAAVKDGLIKADNKNIPMFLHLIDVLRNVVAGDVAAGGKGEIENSGLLNDLLDDIIPAEANGSVEQADREVPQLGDILETEDEGKVEGPPRAKIEQPEALALLREQAPEQALRGKKSASGNGGKAVSRSVNRRDIRVDLNRLDELINLVGELVVAEVMVTHNPDLEGFEFDNFETAARNLNKLVRELQDVALAVRMIPIAGIFRKMIRLVHDLSAKAGKNINLNLVGQETEIDKTVAEQIADPLVHIVRNAIDHGIESPADRLAAGKSEVGQLHLEAKHEGGEVWIVIREDGGGLDKQKILAKAAKSGLIDGDGADMSDHDAFNLIFEPGFSTAAKVTEVSGRGVGMDVVRRNLEKIKGQVDILSEPGKGTTFVLRIPLTLAIIDGMMVRVGDARYTIPMLSIRESIQTSPKKITRTMDGQELVKVREEIIPVIRLHELHKVTPQYTNLEDGILVIVEDKKSVAAIMIDELMGEQQAVVKGLSGYIGNVKGVSGCSILGDGEISLILDVKGILKKAEDQDWGSVSASEIQPAAAKNIEMINKDQ